MLWLTLNPQGTITLKKEVEMNVFVGVVSDGVDMRSLMQTLWFGQVQVMYNEGSSGREMRGILLYSKTLNAAVKKVRRLKEW
jgi:hypothetical protein